MYKIKKNILKLYKNILIILIKIIMKTISLPDDCDTDWFNNLSDSEKLISFTWFKTCHNSFSNDLKIIIDNKTINNEHLLEKIYQNKIDTIKSDYDLKINKLNNELSNITNKLNILNTENNNTITNLKKNHNDQINSINNINNKLIDNLNNDKNILNIKNDNLTKKFDEITTKMHENTLEIQQKLQNNRKSTAEIGNIGESFVIDTINDIFPDYECSDVSDTPHSGDILLLDTDNNSYIIEVKKHKQSIRQKEIDKFKNDIIEHLPYGGIFISIDSSIKANKFFSIANYNGTPCVYISYFKDNINSIYLAIETIKSIHKYSTFINEYSIIEDIMNQINHEIKKDNLELEESIKLTKKSLDIQLKINKQFIQNKYFNIIQDGFQQLISI